MEEEIRITRNSNNGYDININGEYIGNADEFMEAVEKANIDIEDEL